MSVMIRNKMRNLSGISTPIPAYRSMNIEPKREDFSVSRNAKDSNINANKSASVNEEEQSSADLDEDSSESFESYEVDPYKGASLNQYTDNNDNFFASSQEIIEKDYDYILMASGQVIYTGNKSGVEGIISAILQKEKPEFKDITEDDLIVLKKINIKFGVFLEE